MQNLKIAFVGAGNMANSLICGLLKSGYDAKLIWASNRNTSWLNKLAKLNIHIHADNRSVVKEADVLVLAVKPQLLKTVVLEIADIVLEKKPLLISLAVAINQKIIESYLQADNLAIIRAMPNTPTTLGCGATGLFANGHCSSTQKKLAEALFRSVGIVEWCKLEKDIDIIGALSGSGPAYFFLFIEALQNAGIELGLSKETACLLSQQTALGAARMAIEGATQGESVEQLRQNVTSRGGTTQAALKVLEQGQFAELIKKAMLAAIQRTKELTSQFENQYD